MFTCDLDNSKFPDPQSAMKHVRNQHGDLVYDAWEIPNANFRDAEERVFESHIKEE
jgi:hypothetical protein